MPKSSPVSISNKFNKLIAFRNTSISIKIIIAFISLAAIFIISIIGLILQNTKKALLDAKLATVEQSLEYEAEKVSVIYQNLEGVVRSIESTPPIQGIFRAQKNNGLDELGNSTLEEWISRLQVIMVSEIKAYPYIDQLRYMDENGYEVVRVNNVQNEGIIVAKENLQYKGDRPYFNESIKNEPGIIYISPIELNKEGSPPEFSIPYRPVIRVAIPVYDNETGKNKGIIFANILFEKLLDITNLTPRITNNSAHIIDTEGYFLASYYPEYQWSGPNNLNSGYNYRNIFPGFSLPKDILKQQQILGDNIIISSEISIPVTNSSYRLYLIEKLQKNDLFTEINQAIQSLISIGILLFVLFTIFFTLVIKRLLSPLKKLTYTAREIAQGNFEVKLQAKSNDEVGQLTKAFNFMQSQLENSHKSLEETIDTRTKELRKSNEQLHDLNNTLNLEKNRLETVLMAIGDGVFVIDSNKQIILINKVASQLVGSPEKALIGKKYSEVLSFVDEDTRKPVSSFIDAVFEEETIQHMPSGTGMLLKSGLLIPVSDSASPLKDKSGNVIGCVVVFRDISEDKKVEKIKSEFIKIASHQLRTPLTSTRWFLEMILAGDIGEISNEQRDIVNKAYQSNAKMIDLVDGLLNVIKIETSKLIVDKVATSYEPIVLQSIEKIKQQCIDKKIHLEYQVQPNLPDILVDKKIITQILDNLLSNAYKYSPSRAEIKLTVEIRGTELVTQITDTGYGIPEDQHTQVFDKFFRANNSIKIVAEGNGLGLFYVKSLVEASGGRIWFESEENKGTTFWFSLPL